MNESRDRRREVFLLEVEEDPWRRGAPVMVLGGPAGDRDEIAAAAGERLGVNVARLLQRREAGSDAGDVTIIDLDVDSPEALVWLGLGDGSLTSLRRAGAALARTVTRSAVCQATANLSAPELSAFLEGWLLAGYRYLLRSTPVDPAGELSLAVVDEKAAVVGLATAEAISEGVMWARDLGNTPASIKSPDWLAEQAHRLAAGTPGLRCRVLGQRELERAGFTGILAVGQGSSAEPRMAVLELAGPPGATHVALVGKGITFDSGGLSLKPADAMTTMKTDMSGAAAVMAVMAVMAELDPGVRLTAVIPMAENMPSGSAYRPGDVVTQYGGSTTQIVNTDAEGRIVLADALAYVCDEVAPDVVVDLATLTGAATLGLSRHYGALYGNDGHLVEELRDAGEEAGDRVWPMPLYAPYRKALDSEIADICQAPAGVSPGGGSVLAAIFLQHFIRDVQWAHVDIAGPARAEAEHGVNTAGATGFGVRLLSRWLLNLGSREAG